MPRRHEHLARAEENEKLADTLGVARAVSIDWAITMIYYSALHYLDAYLVQSATRPRNHQARDTVIENNGSLAPIWNSYRRLKDLSQEARYEIASYDEAKLNLARRHLRIIKAHLVTKGITEINL